MPVPNVSQLKQALKIAEKLEVLQAELASLMVSATDAPKVVKRGRPQGRQKRTKHTMSPEAREKIAAAQRKRWSKQKKGVEKK